MSSSLATPKIQTLLSALYADAARHRPPASRGPLPQTVADVRQQFHELRHVYMAIGPDFGNLLYTLVRSSKPRTVVEFGTSMGVSTIYLAAGLKDNGGGKLITTEFEPEKVERARKNLTDAGLVEFVDFRIGDAMQMLTTNVPDTIDLVFLDGAKTLYLDVLRLLEPRLRPGSIVAADNTDHEGLENFLAHVRSPANGYLTSAFQTIREGNPSGHEVCLKS